MNRIHLKRLLAPALAATSLLMSAPILAKSALEVATEYAVTPNETYLTADGIDLKLDVYAPRQNTKPRPTLIFFHGGGWVAGSKERSALHVLPYLDRGWAAVNVQYRLGGSALAPAAVQDTRCALHWVARNAKKYGFDTDRIVLSGRSAGGHLALITGMLTADAGFDDRCPGRSKTGHERAAADMAEVPVAAIINWSGITDVNDLIAGPNATAYAKAWLGGQTQASAIAKSVSPLTYVRKNLPPILTLHGDQDRVVPFEHAVRLHEALETEDSPNELFPIPRREHFIDYSKKDVASAYTRIFKFLDKHLK